MTALVWGLEWRRALSRRRNVVLSVLAPLSVVLVVGTDAVPAGAAAAVYTTLFAIFGVCQTSLSVMRDGERGLTLRIVRGGVSPAGYLVQRVGAGATLALAQLLPALVVAAAFLRASITETLLALGALAVTVWIASALGVVAAAVSRSLGELVACCSVVLLLLLHASGVFRTPTAEGFGALVEDLSPFRALHESLDTMIGGGAVDGVGAELVWALALTALIGLLSPGLVGLIERGTRRPAWGRRSV